jgi:phage host-nuclease inhibitor protein Gam
MKQILAFHLLRKTEKPAQNKGKKENMATDRDYDKMVKASRIADVRAEINSLREEASVYVSTGEKEMANEANTRIASLTKELNQLL